MTSLGQRLVKLCLMRMNLVSAASIWEIATKAKIGKIEGDPAEFLEAIEASGFRELKISGVHAAKVHQLALHHRDLFDRLLIAQTLVESMKLLTTDTLFEQYSKLVITVPKGKGPKLSQS